ncbi:MAG TPA: hypothetical protein VFG32_05510 [Bacteroidota bacterium]|nr:hypothetical protein [Bacteroidota bacterium]
MTLLKFLTLVLFLVSFSCKKETPSDPPNGPDTTSHSISWQTDSIGYYSSRLLGVCGTSETNVYAVGVIEDEGTGLPSFLARYNGVSWIKIMDDSLNWWIGAGLLAAVHSLSDTCIFVAGSSFDSNDIHGFVGRWNGRNWQNISPDSSSSLLAIWAKSATDVYVGGDVGTVLHYDGNSWQRLPNAMDHDVRDIVGLSTGEVYAVATDYFNSLVGSFVLRFEGSTVIQEHFFALGRMFGVWGGQGVGLYTTGEGTFHTQDGSTWEEILTPSPSVAMFSVTGISSNNVLVAGSYGAVMHWSGGSWRFYDELYDRSSSRSYFKAFAIGNKYFLVGNTPTHALMTIGTRINQ